MKKVFAALLLSAALATPALLALETVKHFSHF
jgi:hypothetical protein